MVQSLFTPLRLFWRHRVLTYELTRRELKDRYADQVLGALWAFAQPVMLVALYVVVFAYVFKLGATGAMEGTLGYTVYLLSGMIPWLAFQDSLGKTTSVLVGNARLVKQIVFPIEILPVKAAFACFANQLIGSLLLILYVIATTQRLPPTYALLPLLWCAQLLSMTGIGFVFSAVGTYFRDLREIVQMFSMIGVYTLPICYVPGSVPKPLDMLLHLNPFSYMVWCYQDACFFGAITHPWAWVLFLGGSVLVFFLGYATFQRAKLFFGNVL
jgi:lipopolysaccharide transport system permease protein